MTLSGHGYENFEDRIKKIETQNRWLWRVGSILFLLCFFLVGSIGWQLKRLYRLPPSAKRNVIVANQINIVDENGKTQALISGSSSGAFMFVNGPDNASGLIFNPSPGGSSLRVLSPNGKREVTLNTSNELAWLSLGTADGNGAQIQMIVGDGEQNVTVSDGAGFKAVLGSVSLVTPLSGETTNTSAAKLTLFGKDGRVLWNTPKP